jgi:hypothetical protein
MGVQNGGNLNFENCGIPSLESRKKCHLNVAFVVNHIKYYKGEVVASPKFESSWILCIHVCSKFVCAPKVFQQCITNLLFGLCILIWIFDSLIICHSPHRGAPTCPSYPRSVANEKTYFNSFFECFHFGIHIWVFQEVWGCVSDENLDEICWKEPN